MDIGSGLATVKATLDVVRGLRDLDQGLDTAELKAKMSEIYADLAEVRMALVDAEEELKQKDTEIAALQEKFKGTEDLIEHNGFKYRISENGKPIGLPFCPSCLVKDGTQIHPAKLLANKYQCPVCKSNYSNLTHWNG